MRESEFKPILDRDKHERDVKQYFSKHIDLLVDLANYGSNLIPRVYDSSNKKLEDIVIIGVLLKQVVSMIDAVEILISKGAVGPANLQARAAFESSIYIDWILMNESEKKAKYYYVSNLRTQRLWALRLKAGTPEREVFSRTFQYLEKHLKATSLENIEEQATEALSKIDSLLTRNGWKEINLEFDRRKDKKTGAERYWYRMLGITSIRQLAEQVGRLGEYDLFYSRSSEVMHATSYRDHIQFDKGIVFFEPIRQLKDMHNLLRFITSVALSTYMSVLKHYRCGELSHFTRKYVRDWRGAFLNIPTVSYTHRTNGT
jgi:hypothetical protein